MSTFLLVQGIDPLTLADDSVDEKYNESFTKVKGRINQALTGTNRDGDNDTEGKKKPLDKLSFYTDNGDGTVGRVAINPEKIIGVGSTEAKD